MWGKIIFREKTNKGFQTKIAETPNFTGTDGETRTLKGIPPN